MPIERASAVIVPESGSGFAKDCPFRQARNFRVQRGWLGPYADRTNALEVQW